MNILVYTTGATREVGGGRRVTSELLHHMNALGHQAVSWSALPLDPARLNNGRYRYRAEHPAAGTDPADRQALARHFLTTTERLAPDFLLFDTEYSLLEFFQWSEGLGVREHLPLHGALVHDQLWKWDPAILALASHAPDARALAEACPLPGLCAHAVAGRRLFRRAFADRDGVRLLNDLARLEPRPLELAPSTPERLDYCLAMKRAANDQDRIFCLTPRSAREARAAYDLQPGNALCAAGGDSIHHAPQGLDVRARFGLGRERGLLCFSRMSREKNLELALGAFALARRERPALLRDVRVWVAGQCQPEHRDYRDEIHDAVRLLGLEDAVRFLGEVGHEEMRGLYDQADAFVCAQAADFNLTTLQALGAGLPVVLFNGYDFSGDDFSPGLEDCPLVFATARTVADMARDMILALDRRPTLAPRHREALDAMTFEHYARALLRALAVPDSNQEAAHALA